MLFRQLEYFVAVARERHFARAAEACFVSQPALSAAIAKLEKELGVTLINRGHAYQGLTPEGERLALWARRILAEHDAFTAEVRAVRSGVTGRLRLGIGPTTASTAAHLVAAFCAAHPLVQVELVEHLTGREIHRRIRDFELDAGIAYLPAGDTQGVQITPLYQERYAVIATPELVPADATSLSWTDAAQLPLALLNRSMRVRELIDDAFARNGRTVAPQIETESVGALEEYVASGQWASIVPEGGPVGRERPAKVRALPLVNPIITATIVLATTPDDHTSIVTRAFTSVAARTQLRDAHNELDG